MNAIEILRSHEELIRQKFGVKRIGIFGSFVRGEAKEGSDADVMVEFRENAENFDNYIELKYFLQEAFGRDVDLVTLDVLKPQLKDYILREVVYA
jgi:predicted nucleotidyltransferase